MASNRPHDLLFELLRAAARTIGVLLPGVIIGYLSLFSHHDINLEYHLEIVGVFAVATLAITGIICLDRDLYHRFGRLALFMFACWAFGSMTFRILTLLHMISPSERLLGNTIVAIGISVVLHWALWASKVFKDFTRFIKEANHDETRS